MATLNGTPGDDSLVGGSADDELFGLGAEIFQFFGRNSIARAQRKRDSLGVFHLIRESLARFMRRLVG